jgi:hypothetical protein
MSSMAAVMAEYSENMTIQQVGYLRKRPAGGYNQEILYTNCDCFPAVKNNTTQHNTAGIFSAVISRIKLGCSFRT